MREFFSPPAGRRCRRRMRGAFQDASCRRSGLKAALPKPAMFHLPIVRTLNRPIKLKERETVMLKLAATIFISLLVSACGNRSPATAPEAASLPAATASTDASTAAPPVSGSIRPAAEPIVDVPKIAGKSLAEVSSVLGEPTACETIKYGRKCAFKVAETKVVFIAGKADWIAVDAMVETPYSIDALPLLGFEKRNPTFSNEHVKGRRHFLRLHQDGDAMTSPVPNFRMMLSCSAHRTSR
jgi:hypothetical protein